VILKLPFITVTVELKVGIKRREKPIPFEEYSILVDDLGLSVRTLNCLRRGGIYSLGELRGRSDMELLVLRNFGVVCLLEVHRILGK